LGGLFFSAQQIPISQQRPKKVPNFNSIIFLPDFNISKANTNRDIRIPTSDTD